MEEEKLLPTLITIILIILYPFDQIWAKDETSHKLQEEILILQKDADKNVQGFLANEENRQLIKSITSNQLKQEELFKQAGIEAKTLPYFEAFSREPYQLLVFISLSQPEQGLIELGKQVKAANGALILRGLVDGSYKKTILALENFIDKAGIGVSIDPELFTKYQIKQVPTFVITEVSKACAGNLTCIPASFDKLTGNVSLNYALDKFAQEGDLGQVMRQNFITKGKL
jgi:type-F conjugative transfer system pilin assembly protein TrbC